MQPTSVFSSAPVALAPADVGARIVAHLIDVAPFLLLPCFAVIPCIGVLLIMLGGLASLPYLLCRELLFDGRSFGKRVMKLRVLDARTGQRPDTGTLVLRNLVLLIPLFPLIEFIVLLTEPRRRRFGDQWFNTIVVASEL